MSNFYPKPKLFRQFFKGGPRDFPYQPFCCPRKVERHKLSFRPWVNHGGVSNDSCCHPSTLYTITCKTLLSSKYMVDNHKYDTSDFAVVPDMIRLSIYSDSKSSHVMVYKVLGQQHRYHHLNHPRVNMKVKTVQHYF